jgi:predicted regulator of Ras-like GTPase activity (Roadblock/LC7/MglB family)
MKIPAQPDLQRWSDEVARDPKSLAFLPLARAYRKQGLRDAALHLCLRGLETYPAHVEAHGLLALLYLDAGDHEKAADEWSTVLRVDPDNFEALRGMGFCYLEQDRLTRARQMLERAALLRPGDATIQEALRVLGARQDETAPAAPELSYGADPWSTTAPAAAEYEPWSVSAEGPIFMFEPAPAPEEKSTTASEPSVEPRPRIVPAVPISGPVPLDPTLLFDDLLAAGPLMGVLLVDTNGLVLAGRMTEAVRGDPAVLGGVLGGAILEATRTASYLELGNWRGILLNAEHALLHLAPAGAAAVLVLAARRDAPAGWMLRASAHALALAQQFIQEYA